MKEFIQTVIEWVIANPEIVIPIVGALTPFIALIPVVGAPLAELITKIITATSPAVKRIGEAFEDDQRPLDEKAKDIERKIIESPETNIGTVIGTKILAKIAARRLAKKKK